MSRHIANHGYTGEQRRIKNEIRVDVDRMPVTDDVNLRVRFGKSIHISLWFYAPEFDEIARSLGYERRPF